MMPKSLNFTGHGLGKLTNWLSLKRLRDQDCLKRGGGELPLVLDELAETLDSGFDTEKELETKELNRENRHLLGKLEKKNGMDFSADTGIWLRFPKSRKRADLQRARLKLCSTAQGISF